MDLINLTYRREFFIRKIWITNVVDLRIEDGYHFFWTHYVDLVA